MKSGSIWINNKIDDFNKGDFNRTQLNNSPKVNITLSKTAEGYYDTGVYTSHIIETLPFNQLILSWNADTPAGTSIQIYAQVLVNLGETQKWSTWLSWGTWSTSAESGSVKDSEDELAKVDTDILKIKGSGFETACAIRYQLILKTSNIENTPSIRLVAGTIKNTKASNETKSVFDEENISGLENLNKVLDVPRFSQMLRDPKIASIICSPTSITMLANYHGFNLVPELTAAKVYDTVYDGYGNWPFNTAYAGSLGFESYVAYCSSIDDLKQEVQNGYPLAVSVRYKNDDAVEANLPVIHGAPIKKTNGHLIVVCGFISENGKEYIVVNDPAADSDEAVRLKYEAAEFDAAWKTSGRVAYIIHP